jgi:elongation factor P--(R)-beta-lysine ligase
MSRDDFAPTASWQRLRQRADILRRLRAFFDARGFVEVETPLLSHDTVIDRHLDPLAVTLFRDPRAAQDGPTLYLQTSPEFGMKRLLARGDATAIYQLTRAFRGAEQGTQHNPEFTILEWYRVGDDYAAGMALLAELAQAMFATPVVERITYRDAFRRHANQDPFANPLDDFEEDRLLATQVQPRLGEIAPTILYDYPAAQAALAQVRPESAGGVAERFELFYRGVELANGYHELLDPEALRRRQRAQNAARQADGKYALPEESRLLAAMEQGLPPCSGCALGVDRLVMLLTGTADIRDVLAFPIDRA